MEPDFEKIARLIADKDPKHIADALREVWEAGASYGIRTAIHDPQELEKLARRVLRDEAAEFGGKLVDTVVDALRGNGFDGQGGKS